jgi:hypothetical protein
MLRRTQPSTSLVGAPGWPTSLMRWLNFVDVALPVVLLPVCAGVAVQTGQVAFGALEVIEWPCHIVVFMAELQLSAPWDYAVTPHP